MFVVGRVPGLAVVPAYFVGVGVRPESRPRLRAVDHGCLRAR